MKGICISDDDGRKTLAFDLRDLLRLVGDDAISYYWEINHVECLGVGAQLMHDASDSDLWVPGSQLLLMAQDVYQIIDGDFKGYRAEVSPEPWIVFRAIDSSYYDVLSDNLSLLEFIRQQFHHVVEIEY